MKLRLNAYHPPHAHDSLQSVFLFLILCWFVCSFVLSAWVSCIHKENDGSKTPDVMNSTKHLSAYRFPVERGAGKPAGKLLFSFELFSWELFVAEVRY